MVEDIGVIVSFPIVCSKQPQTGKRHFASDRNIVVVRWIP